MLNTKLADPLMIYEGMILAAGPGGDDLFILNPDKGAEAGMKVK